MSTTIKLTGHLTDAARDEQIKEIVKSTIETWPIIAQYSEETVEYDATRGWRSTEMTTVSGLDGAPQTDVVMGRAMAGAPLKNSALLFPESIVASAFRDRTTSAVYQLKSRSLRGRICTRFATRWTFVKRQFTGVLEVSGEMSGELRGWCSNMPAVATSVAASCTTAT